MEVQKGMRDKLSKYVDLNQTIEVTLRVTGRAVYDFCCFGVGNDNKLTDDRYMIFYNQTASPDRAITYTPLGGAVFRIDTRRIPESVQKLVFTVSIDGEGTMGEIESHELMIGNIGGDSLTAKFPGDTFAGEKAVITAEIYRRDEWRFNIVVSGFNGGLGDLLRYYGGSEDAVSRAAVKNEGNVHFGAEQSISPEAMLEKKLAKAPELVSLARPLMDKLEKEDLTDCKAKVVLVTDITGSMLRKYRSGEVQSIVNKMLPVAVQFDDDGELDLWYYAKRCEQRESLTPENYSSAVPDNWRELMSRLGGENDEPVIIRSVMEHYSDISEPVYVIFITDGGACSTNRIKELIAESSQMPVFWQFIGIGSKGSDVLEEVTDSGNTAAFAVEDIKSISDEELYDRLLDGFPEWLSGIREQGLV